MRVALLIVMLALAAPSLAAPESVRAAPPAQVDSCVVAVQAALGKIGAGYVWGAKGPESFDCSGLTYWAYQQAGIHIGVSTYDQQAAGVLIACSLADIAGTATTCWQPGDLIFLRYPGGQHVALYAGDGLVADAYNPAHGVILHDPKADSFYQANFWQARRPTNCAGSILHPGEPSTLPPGSSPSIEAIADILPPISLMLPWSCGNCGSGQANLTELPVPEVSFTPIYPFQWFGVWIWNNLFLNLICWLLSIAQAMLNALAYAFNSVLVAGINLFWRVAILALLWMRDMFLALWSFVGWLRSFWWQAYLSLLYMSDQIAQMGIYIEKIAQLISLILVAMGELVINAAQAITYLLGLFMAVVAGLSVPSIMPTQYTEIETFFILQWFIDIIRAFADSKLGWVWVAFVGIVYLRFDIWLLEELSTFNE